jgi:large subunit ribosomal protein L25
MEIQAKKRDALGKRAKAIRRAGFIPAELYGHGVENLHLSVPAKEFTRVFREAGESTLIEIVINGERKPVMIHDVARHPVTDEALNIDFYQVRMDERITVKVPLTFIGEAPAVKELGGVLVKSMHEIEIEALPNAIPHSLDVSVSGIVEIGGSVYVKDVKAPESATILVQPDTVIATVTERVSEEEEAAAPAVSVESVKVEGEEERLERQAKKGKESEEQTETQKKKE